MAVPSPASSSSPSVNVASFGWSDGTAASSCLASASQFRVRKNLDLLPYGSQFYLGVEKLNSRVLRTLDLCGYDFGTS